MEPLQKKIGIIGGGQLGKMMILAAKQLGFYVTILDPSLACPAHSIADEHLVAGFDDAEAIFTLAQLSDVVTYELEHISVVPLKTLAASGKTVYPAPESLEVIQNKLTQKRFLRDHGLPVPDFCEVSALSELKQAGERFGYPLMLKTCTGGYDGRGNAMVTCDADVPEIFALLGGGKVPLLAEKFVPFVKEISVLSCRGTDGTLRVYPVAENRHENSILWETRVPAAISADAYQEAMSLAQKTMVALEGVGMFCTELFITQQDTILINELAPRPHNSGHYTIEACPVSQFENHVRAITGLPLGDASLTQAAVMVNLLGEGAGRPSVEGLDALSIPGLSLHVYGKSQVSPNRKMGHFTVTAQTLPEAIAKRQQAKFSIKGETPCRK